MALFQPPDFFLPLLLRLPAARTNVTTRLAIAISTGARRLERSFWTKVDQLVESKDLQHQAHLPRRRDDDQASSEAGKPSVEAQERLGPGGVHEGHASDVEVILATLPVQCPRYRVFECWRGADIEFAGHVESFLRAGPSELESQEVIGDLGSAVG
jgi:hypothetical protein